MHTQPTTYPNTSIFDFKLNNAAVRYGIIVLIALANAHIRGADFYNYHFPYRSFVSGLIFGLVICTSCWGVTLMVKGILFKDGKFSKANIARFLGSNLLVSISVYCGLYLAFFGIPGSRTNFFAYLFVTIAVVSIENLAYILYSHLKTLKQEVSKASITIPMRNREQTLASTDIAMVEINNGIVRFHLNNQQVLISDFKTIDEVEQKLPVDSFFRTSRQVLINRKHVHELKKEPNRTLTLSLDFTASNLTVSRYKRKAFLDWYRNS